MHFKKYFKIHGNLSHEPLKDGVTIRWLIYLINDNSCKLQYIGSTIELIGRWANHKSSCNSKWKKNKVKNVRSTGLSGHFSMGCHGDEGKLKKNLKIILLDYYDTTNDKLKKAGHIKGAGCKCLECKHLKRLESEWMCKMGTLYGRTGLNTREEFEEGLD